MKQDGEQSAPAPSLEATQAATTRTDATGLEFTVPAPAADPRAVQSLEETRAAGLGQTSDASSNASWDGISTSARAVGRYLLIGELGRGGMGIVYKAYDPKLERRVAIKVVKHPSLARSLEEAQAMARLNHPNVVTVYDVGELNDRVFMAMELVDGEPLSRWCRRTAPPLPELLRVFGAAARGLAAAHDAGLVHRDFKPDNVMIAKDGRVLVMDFGLAIERRADDDDLDATASSSVSPLAWAAGTPAYMSPEQFEMTEVGPPSDQFSFFVAMYEAVTGSRPFQGDTLPGLAMAVVEGKLADDRALRSTPAWLRRLISKGLEVDPEARHPSMHAVVQALSEGTSRRRRRRLLAVGGATVAVLAATAGILIDSRQRQAAACEADGLELAESWLPSWSDVARQRFREEVDGPAIWADVERNVQDFVTQWRGARIQACRAHFETGGISERDLSVRLGCLSEQRTFVTSLLESVNSSRPDAVRQVGTVTWDLPRPAYCNDADRLTEESSASEFEEVARARLDFMRAAGLERAGELQQAETLVAELITHLEPFDAPVTKSQALSLLARLTYAAGDLARGHQLRLEAIGHAVDAADRNLIAETWLDHGEAVLSTENDYEAAQVLLEPVTLAVRAAPPEDHLEINLAAFRGTVDLKNGRTGAARVQFEQALAHAPENTSLPLRATLLSRLAAATAMDGDPRAAKSIFEEAAAIKASLYGEHHHQVIASYSNLGLVCRQLGDRDCEREHLEHARELASPGSTDLAGVLVTLAQLDYDQDDIDRAQVLVDEAVDIYREHYGNEHAALTSPMLLRCHIYAKRGDYRAQEREALALHELARATTPEEHPKRAVALVALAGAKRDLGDLEGARETFQRALEIRLSALDPTDIRIAYVQYELALVYFRLNERQRSRELAEQALSILDASTGGESWIGKVSFLLAQTTDDPVAARKHAERALAVYATEGPPSARARAQVESWLAERGTTGG